ncbi:MAG: peptidase [Flavobacterium sp.]|nr:peptidase [Candidatus Neoflavobacterium equi]
MPHKKRKKKKWIKTLTTNYRLVLLNEKTFEELISLRLRLLPIFVFISLSGIFLIFATTLIIAFTPLREYIPGYASTSLKEQTLELSVKTDSLIKIINSQQEYSQSIQKVLRGELEYAKLNIDSIVRVEAIDIPEEELVQSKAERALIEANKQKNIKK